MAGRPHWFLAVLALGGVLGVATGCDAVRYPGDGGETPQTPRGDDRDGLPGPPPPVTPISDPYGNGDSESVPDPSPPADPGDRADGDDPAATDLPPEDPSTGETGDADPEDGESETPETGDASTGGDTEPGNSAPESPVDGEPSDDAIDPSDGADPDATPAPADPETPAPEPVFSYFPPGQLLPGSGTGAFEQIVHAPDMVFPIRSAPAFLQSQVWSFGGGVAGGDQCDSRNYDYPWRDNFCEMRTADRGTPFCPQNRVHQGQDIRVGTPADCRQLRAAPRQERSLHDVVAAESGIIYDIGTYTVKLRSGGRIYRYMHLNMAELQVSEGDTVEAGDVLGFVSNDFGGTPTTFHLHFEIIQNTEAYGWEHVPPYLSLVEAYERRQNGVGEELPVDVATASSRILPIPEGLEIIE